MERAQVNTIVRKSFPSLWLSGALLLAATACGPAPTSEDGWEELGDEWSDEVAEGAEGDEGDDAELIAAEAPDDDWVVDDEGYDDEELSEEDLADGEELYEDDDGEPLFFSARSAGSAEARRHRQVMTYATANIGRKYRTKAEVQRVFDRIGDTLGAKQGPKLIGWQEIGEGDPCGGSCEMKALRKRFASDRGWKTRRPRGRRPSGAQERVKVPVTSKGADQGITARAVFASPPWTHVSPTRFVTVVHYPSRNVSVLNTHLIAGAWSCKSNREQRRAYWRMAWRTLKKEVAKEHRRGRNVIVTGDFNRPRSANRCNPGWDPTSLHPRAKIVGGQGIDYIFAVPAAGQRFKVATRPSGSKKRGSIQLGIDGHKAHWVSGRFLPR